MPYLFKGCGKISAAFCILKSENFSAHATTASTIFSLAIQPNMTSSEDVPKREDLKGTRSHLPSESDPVSQ